MDADPDAWVRIDPDGRPGSAPAPPSRRAGTVPTRSGVRCCRPNGTPAAGRGRDPAAATSSAAATCPSSSSTTRSPTPEPERSRPGCSSGRPPSTRSGRCAPNCATRCGWPRCTGCSSGTVWRARRCRAVPSATAPTAYCVHDLANVLDDYDERFADRIAVARGEIATVPSQIGECRSCRGGRAAGRSSRRPRTCRWWRPGRVADVLRERGVRTVRSLAAWEGDAPEECRTTLSTTTVVTAKAWIASAPWCGATRP